MAEPATTSSGKEVRSLRINCDSNLSQPEIEQLQHLLETSRYHFSVQPVFPSQTYDSIDGRPSISLLIVRTSLLLRFSLSWTRTEQGALKTAVKAVDEVILNSTHPNRIPKVIYDANGGVAIEIEETDTPRKKREPWTRREKLAVYGLILSVVGITLGLLRTEARHFFRLKEPQPAQVEMKPTSPAPQPAQTIQNPEPPKPEPSEPRKVQKTAQKATTQVKGNGNVAGNNIAGNNNVIGNGNQAGPTAIAPNGIAISGGTVIQPTVNNFGQSARRLSDDQKKALMGCLAVKTGTFTIGAIANNGEAYQYAKDFSDVFSGAGWKNEQPIPVAIIMIAGGMWAGVRISVHGTWDDRTKTASLIDAAPETLGLDCLRTAKVAATAIPWTDMRTGSIRVDVSEHPQ